MCYAKRTVFCFLIYLLLLMPVLGAGESSAYAAERMSLRVGYTSMENFLSRDGGGHYAGIAYEYLEGLAAYIGVEFEYLPGSRQQNEERLQNGSIDMFIEADHSFAWLMQGQPFRAAPGAIYQNDAGFRQVLLGEGVGVLCLNENAGELADRMKSGLIEMTKINPFYRLNLEKKYYQNQTLPLMLTDEERAYLQQKKVLYAMASPGQPPYTWFDGDIHRGVVADIMRQIEKDLDIRIQVLPETNQGDMMEHLAAGDIDLVTDFFADYNWARAHNADITFPYLSLSYVPVTRRDRTLPEHPSIACPRNHYYVRDYIEKHYLPGQLRYYDTIEDCLEAVDRGKADLTMVKSITLQDYIYRKGFYNLYTSGNVLFSHKVSMAVSHQADPMLVRILNKEIAHLNQQDIKSIINREVYQSQSKDSVRSLIYRNPVGTVVFLSVIFATVVLMMLFWMRMRRRHGQELYRQAHVLEDIGMYNLRWFRQELPGALEQYQEDREAGRLFLMVLSAQHISFLKEVYHAGSFRESIMELIRKVRAENDWLLIDAMTSDLFSLIVLCRRPAGMSMKQAAAKVAHDARTCVFNGTPTSVRYHIGLCAIPPKGDIHADTWIDNAFSAHNETMATRRSVGVYDYAMQNSILRQKQMESLMEKALAKGEFKVYLQAKYNIDVQSVCAAESLVRWESPELGFLMPGQFIGLFEHNGFIVQLDYYMLEQVCQYQKNRLEHGQITVPISVNQSGMHIKEENYLERMQAIADKYHLPSGLIDLELTETAFIDFSTQDARRDAFHIVTSLKKMGYRLSMDDFCTGYSSIAMLQNLPMDVMKIDRSMLLAAETSPRALTILRHVVELGHSLDMRVLVEGIETKPQELLLLGIDCHYGQGFLFAKPMPADEFSAFMEHHATEGRILS